MGRNNDGAVHAAAVSDDTVDGPQAPPYCRFFTIAFVLTLVLVVFPIIVQLVWMFFKSERVTYHPWKRPCSENFPVSIIVGAFFNLGFLKVGFWLFMKPEWHKSQGITRSFQFLTSKRFKLGPIQFGVENARIGSKKGRSIMLALLALALVVFPIVVFWPILNMATHSNFLFFRCKDLCWHMSKTDGHTGLDFSANDKHGDFKVTWMRGKGKDDDDNFTVHDPAVDSVVHDHMNKKEAKKSANRFRDACSKYISFDEAHENWKVWKQEDVGDDVDKFLPDREESFGTKEDTQYVLNQCYDIMSPDMTKVAERLVRNNYRVLAFNSAMRNYYSISSSESFFEILIGAVICMLLASAYISMKRQESEVRVRMLRLFRRLNRHADVSSGNGFVSLRKADEGLNTSYLDEFYDTTLFVEQLANWKLSDYFVDEGKKLSLAAAEKQKWINLSKERADEARDNAMIPDSGTVNEHRSFTSAVLSHVLKDKLTMDKAQQMQIKDKRSNMLHRIQMLLAASDLEKAERTEQGTTSSTAAVDQGATVMPVESQAGFDIGVRVDIEPGTAVHEVKTIVGFGSLVFDSPLQHAHEEGAVVAVQAVEPGTEKLPWTDIRAKIPQRKYLIALTSKRGFVFLGLLGWLGHALVGCVVRGIQNKAFFITGGFSPSLAGSMLFGFVVNMVLWLALGRCIDGLEYCLSSIKAFDVTFHFPGDEALSRLESLGDVENREFLIEKFRVDFAKTGEDLMIELSQLQMWGDIRMMFQTSQNVEKVDMELHLIIVLFALVCRIAIVVGNYVVMEKDGNRKMQIINFVVIYDLCLILFVLFKCIFLCKDVNDAFGNHTVNLAKLQRHVSLEANKLEQMEKVADENEEDISGKETVRTSQPPATDATAARTKLAKTRFQQADPFVQAFLNNVEATDSPMRMFGFVINRYTVAAGVTTALGLLVPSIMPMLYFLVHKAHVV